MQRFIYILFRLLPFASFLLTSCSSYTLSRPEKTEPVSGYLWHQNFTSIPTHYKIQGTFAFISSKKRAYAYFNWRQTNFDRYRLTLTNPFGGIAMDLNVESGMAYLTNSKGNRYVSNNPEMMIQKLVGIPIPLNELRQWVFGLPGSAKNFTLDSRGYLNHLSYNYNGQSCTLTCWNYNYYAMKVLPSNLELRQGDNRIKLKIYKWHLT